MKKSIEETLDGYMRMDPLKFKLLCMHTKFPATVMAFGVVSSEEHTTAPQFIPQDLKANADTYAPWINSAANGRPFYVFLQDSASSPKVQNPELEGREFSSYCHTKLVDTSKLTRP
ncbi:hypothetical protein ACTXT7_016841 [Hymenolepis weldensis]